MSKPGGLEGQSLTGHLLRLLERPIEPADRERAAWHLLDWIGCAFLGRSAPAGRALAQWAAASASGPCTAWGAGSREASAATLLNGGLGNLFELDDVHRQSILHPGDTVVPAALAAVQREGVSGTDLLEALIQGYEVAIRIGAAAGPTHYRHWYSTATCGVYGAALACARVLSLGHAQQLDALGQAGMMSAGLWQCRQEPTFSKQLATGRSAQSGLLAADLARIGFPGARQILEGSHGFFAACCEQPDPHALIADADAPWRLHEVSFKPWPACRHVHPTIACALQAHAQGVQPQAVRHAEVLTYGVALRFADCPHPQTAHEARFSLQHALAWTLLRGSFTLQASHPSVGLADAQCAALRERVTLSVEPSHDRDYPTRYGASLRLELHDGQVLSLRQDHAPGDPELPLSSEAICSKARGLLQDAGWERAQAQTLVDQTLALPVGGDLNAWRAHLTALHHKT